VLKVHQTKCTEKHLRFRSMIQERVRADLARARAAGAKLGWPRIPKETEAAHTGRAESARASRVRKIAAHSASIPRRSSASADRQPRGLCYVRFRPNRTLSRTSPDDRV